MTEGFEIMLFQVGSRCFASDVDRIRAILTGEAVNETKPVRTSALGSPFIATRGLAVEQDGELRTLVVDQVLGVRSITASELRPMPEVAAACLRSQAFIGFAMVDEVPIVLVDLPMLIEEVPHRELPAATAAEMRPPDAE